MRVLQLLSLSCLFACAVEHGRDDDNDDDDDDDDVYVPVEPSPAGVDVSTHAVEDIRCTGVPDAGPATSWRHSIKSRLVVELGAPHHRGIDLIAAADDATQLVTGRITYGITDKDLEDESVDLFACLGDRWQRIGSAITDDEGRFSLSLSDDDRLPVGMRDLYVSVGGDRTGVPFLAFVAPRDTQIVVSDVDGTLTASENAYPEALVLGGDTPAHDGAAAALLSVATRNFSVIYVTARGDRFTQDTRDWFSAKGFPRGPVRMPQAIITTPGEDTVEFKSAAIESLSAFQISAGIGNRGSDITAYTNVGLAPSRILIKLPEFTDEVAAALAAGDATGFTSYDDLRTMQLASL